jgi:hypothetical protein
MTPITTVKRVPRNKFVVLEAKLCPQEINPGLFQTYPNATATSGITTPGSVTDALARSMMNERNIAQPPTNPKTGFKLRPSQM